MTIRIHPAILAPSVGLGHISLTGHLTSLFTDTHLRPAHTQPDPRLDADLVLCLCLPHWPGLCCERTVCKRPGHNGHVLCSVPRRSAEVPWACPLLPSEESHKMGICVIPSWGEGSGPASPSASRHLLVTLSPSLVVLHREWAV